MINIVTLSSLALATLHMAVTPASAHGYVIYPPSRQARCKAGEVPHCGDVQWDAHSVEAPKGSFKCNGDGPRFAELNDDALWKPYFYSVAPNVDSLTFTWTLPVPHKTASWEYFVITEHNALLTSFNDHNRDATPSHSGTRSAVEWLHREADGSRSLECRGHYYGILFLR